MGQCSPLLSERIFAANRSEASISTSHTFTPTHTESEFPPWQTELPNKEPVNGRTSGMCKINSEIVTLLRFDPSSYRSWVTREYTLYTATKWRHHSTSRHLSQSPKSRRLDPLRRMRQSTNLDLNGTQSSLFFMHSSALHEISMGFEINKSIDTEILQYFLSIFLLVWLRIGSALLYRGLSVFPYCCCSMKSSYRMPARDSN